MHAAAKPSYQTFLAALLVTGCAAGNAVQPVGSGSQLRVVNGAGSGGAMQVYVDGNALPASISFGEASAVFSVDTGTHTLELRPASGGAGFIGAVEFAPGRTALAVAFDSAGMVSAAMLDDTNAVVPAGATKVRVAHMASSAPAIDIWRTQPDFETPIRVQFPFHFRDISPYLQSTPGDWRVMVSDAVQQTGLPLPPMPDTLGNSGAITVTTGTSRTVIVVDKPGGGVALVVIEP